ncbi:MAG: hypothetical protein ACR2KK_02970 [Acidimicrobiales bacterium]
MAAYRRVVVLYPRSFRREYGEDLVALFADQLRDERAAQVWARTIRDLVTSVPLQRMEAFMRRPSDNLVAAAATTVSIVSLVLAATAATPAVLFAAAAVGMTSGLMAMWFWQAGRPLATPSEANTTATWWRFLLAGGVGLGASAVIAVLASENFAGWYWPWFLSLVASAVLLGIGLLLALAHLVWGRRHPRVQPAR